MDSEKIDPSVEIIGKYAYSNNNNFNVVSIPSGVIKIEEHAFQNCRSLNIIILPKTLKEIENNVFWNCNLINKIYYHGSKDDFNSIKIDYGNDALHNATIEYNSKVSKIEQVTNERFDYLLINDNEVIINKCKLNEIKVLDLVSEFKDLNVISLNYNALDNCQNITEVVIPKSLVNIERSTFNNCNVLKKITVENGNPRFMSGNYNALIDKKTKSLILGAGDTIIPEGVTTIKDGAFMYNKALRTIKIPSTVTYIEINAFWYAENLVAIELPKSIKHIESSVFGNSGLSVVYYEGTEADFKKIYVGESSNNSINRALIRYNSKMESESYNATDISEILEIKSGKHNDRILIKYLAKDEKIIDLNTLDINILSINCITNNYMSEKIIFPNNLEKFIPDAIKYCSNLKSISLNNSNKYYEVIDNSLIEKATNTLIFCFEYSNIPSSVKNIGTRSIYGTREILYIPNGVEKIQKLAFENLYNCKTFYLPKTLKKIEDNNFNNLNSDAKIYYEGSRDEFNSIEIGNNNDMLSIDKVVFKNQ